jgi:hypothetical protein
MTDRTTPAVTERDVEVARSVADRAFRQIRDRDRRADMIADAIAIAWADTARAGERIGNPSRYFISCIKLAVSAVKSGRNYSRHRSPSVGRQDREHRIDGGILSLDVQTADQCGTLGDMLLDESASIPDVVATKLDYESFVRGLPNRLRKVLYVLSIGGDCRAAGELIGMSEGNARKLRGIAYEQYRSYMSE